LLVQELLEAVVQLLTRARQAARLERLQHYVPLGGTFLIQIQQWIEGKPC
jgi:hypothetical protein